MRDPGLEELPDSARIWIFGSNRDLDAAEADDLLVAVDEFLEGWTAHGTALRAACSWRYGRFLIVGVDAEATPPSGCAIDALVRTLRGTEDRLDTRLLGNEAVWYRSDGGAVRCASRPEFRVLVREGDVTLRSVVFDNSITSLGRLRAGCWEVPASESWHAAFFAR